MYTSALAAPPRYQWEANSAPSQAYNCGPTCVARIAQFYKDKWFGIEAIRRLVTTCCHSTTYRQQAAMLTKAGVPAGLVNITSIKQLRSIVGSGRRPVILALKMSRIPASVRGHSFLGWHAVVCVTTATVNGVSGFYINDPNFSTYRPDRTGGKRFYSDAVLQYAFINNTEHWAIVPYAAKVVSTTAYVKFNTGVHVSLRATPDARVSGAWAIADWASNAIRRTADNVWIGHTDAKRTLYGTVNGYRTDGTRQTYYKLRLKGTNRYLYVDTRFMHRV